MAFKVHPRDWPETAAYLEERELKGYAYQPAHLPVHLCDGRILAAHCFTADPHHPHYAGLIPPSEAAKIILKARGEAGLNRDYLINTVQALEEHGYTDQDLHDLLGLVQEMTGEINLGAGASAQAATKKQIVKSGNSVHRFCVIF
jgi:cation transport protein ChaC